MVNDNHSVFGKLSTMNGFDKSLPQAVCLWTRLPKSVYGFDGLPEIIRVFNSPMIHVPRVDW